MRIAPVLTLGLVSLLAGCQWLPWSAKPPSPAPQRLQGELITGAGNLVLRPCHEPRQLAVVAADSLGLPYAVARLRQGGARALFADLGGQVQEASGDQPPRLLVERLYRLQPGLDGCDDPQFKRLIARAGGHQPDWSVSVGAQGMMLQRPGVAPLALPYVEERLPDGSLNFSSEANGHRVELWLTPGRCTDTASGALSHLEARLQLDHQPPQLGCAALGGRAE